MPRKSYKLEDITPDQLKLVAIASHEPDYRISWLINSSLNIQLCKTSDHAVSVYGSGAVARFSCFFYADEDLLMEYHLVSNHSEMGYLLPRYRNIDYFLHISGTPGADFLRNLITRLKKTQGIITAFEMVLSEPRFIRLFQFT